MFSSQDMGILSHEKWVSQIRLNIHGKVQLDDIFSLETIHHPPDFFSLSAARLACKQLIVLIYWCCGVDLSDLHLSLLLGGGLARVLLLLGLFGRLARSLGLLLLLVVRLGGHPDPGLLSEIIGNQVKFKQACKPRSCTSSRPVSPISSQV